MTPDSPLFLCVDVGGSKTAASIASSQGVVIGRGYAGSGNLAEVGASRCFASIRKAVQGALEAIGGVPIVDSVTDDVCPIAFQDIWVGIAGCDTAFDEAKIAPSLSQYFQRSITPTNDALLLASHALLSGTRYGIALVSGTGSVILGLEIPSTGHGSADGPGIQKPIIRCRKGGNGHLLGDHGSAYHLGVTAARIAADDYSMGKSTDAPLYARLCVYYGVQNPGDLPARIHELDPSLDAIDASNRRKLLIADSSALVLESIVPTSDTPPTDSRPPDSLGIRVVTTCIDILTDDIHDVVTTLQQQTTGEGMNGFQAAQATLAMTGGIVARPVFREMLITALEKRGVQFKDTTFIDHAADHGAVGLSRAFSRGER